LASASWIFTRSRSPERRVRDRDGTAFNSPETTE
jgi:hypothetical protein